jgi:hypothetical protein
MGGREAGLQLLVTDERTDTKQLTDPIKTPASVRVL